MFCPKKLFSTFVLYQCLLYYINFQNIFTFTRILHLLVFKIGDSLQCIFKVKILSFSTNFSKINFQLTSLNFVWPNFVIFIGFLFRFLISCFDSLHIFSHFLNYFFFLLVNFLASLFNLFGSLFFLLSKISAFIFSIVIQLWNKAFSPVTQLSLK